MAKIPNYRLRRILTIVVFVALFCAVILLNPRSYQKRDDILSSAKQLFSAKDIALKDTQTFADSTRASDVLEHLAVKEKDFSQKYYRKQFYDDWGDAADGCSIREVVLRRDLSDAKLNGCKVLSGVLHDPYTGKDINFTRGQDTSAAVQIDHVVALSNAWSTGASRLDASARYNLSQDPLNLIAVDGLANQDKSDQDAASWLPENVAFRCQYVARQISVKYKYHLWVTPAEKASMKNVLEACPDEPTRGLDNLQS
ncbi:HNH endonuclease [Candidatus Saccharibacteria bacterium]|nr:HNH endonuclease [Candidatus Saccharibacteria bacterium]